MSEIPILTQTRTEYQTLHTKRQELLGKSELTNEEFKELDDIAEKSDTLLAKIKTLTKSLETREEIPVVETNRVPVGGQATVIDMTKSGQTHIDLATKQVIDEFGGGFLSQKKMIALMQPGYAESLEAYGRAKGDLSKLSDVHRKALEEGLDPQGGYFIPPQYIMRLVSRLAAPTRVQGRVQNFQTGKDKIILPRNVYDAGSPADTYTTPFRVTWTGENPTSSTQHRVTDTGMFGTLTIDVFTAMLSSVLTKDMVEDSDFPILSWVADKFLETIMLLRDEMILKGDGIKQPYGIMTNPGGDYQPDVVLSGTANTVTPDEIRGLPFELAEQYINDNCAWVMNRKNAGKTIALFKDLDDRFMWARGSMDDKLQNPLPDTLDGYPVAYSTFMDDIGDAKYPILFGDLMGYYLVNRIGISITFYYDSVYDQLNQVGVGGRIRFGGKTGEPWRLKIQKSDNV